MYVGPLPPASEFSKYEQALPGTAERILSIAEKEVEHRHKNEDKLINQAVKQSSSGQILAFILSILSLAAVGLSVVFNQPVASIAPAIIAITGLVSIFTNRK